MVSSPERQELVSNRRETELLLKQTGVEKVLNKVAKEKRLKDAKVVWSTDVDGKPIIRLCWDWYFCRESPNSFRQGSGWVYHYISVEFGYRNGEPKLAILGRYRPEGNRFESGGVLTINRNQFPLVEPEEMRRAVEDAMRIPEWMGTIDLKIKGPRVSPVTRLKTWFQN